MTRILALTLLALGFAAFAGLAYILVAHEPGTGPDLVVCGALGVVLAGLGAALLWSSR